MRDWMQNLFSQASRAYVMEGQLYLCSNFVTRRFELRYFFLFSDIMVSLLSALSTLNSPLTPLLSAVHKEDQK